MRSFFHSILRRRPKVLYPSKATARTMSGGTISAALYACTITPPSSLGAVPEDSGAKAHHLKDGKGFVNPWDSWKDMSAPEIIKAMLW
jgi:N-acyl-phosphatidylethanolamine-hydrolysing phospholipase D